MFTISAVLIVSGWLLAAWFCVESRHYKRVAARREQLLMRMMKVTPPRVRA